MLAKGPDLRIKMVPYSEKEYTFRARMSKGKKNVFNDEILISNRDAERLKRQIQDKFTVYKPPAAK